MPKRTIKTFENRWRSYTTNLHNQLSTQDAQWTMKGVIDTNRHIYPLTADTKVISKLLEMMLFPLILRFAEQHSYQMVPSEHQNHYPDITFIAPDETKIAFDLKSTYRLSSTRVNGFTLGAFTGYFRNRNSLKNITYPYSDYSAHYIFGVIYSRQTELLDELSTFTLEQLTSIPSIIHDFEFIFQPKWKIASDRPGSGNTKNIGSENNIETLLNGTGRFTEHGKVIFSSSRKLSEP